MPPGEALIRTREAIAKANELDAATVEASPHPSILEMFHWNFERTEVKSRRAIALNPDDPTVYKFWARQLRAMGRWTEAIAAGRRALKLDPMGVQSNTELATSYAWQGDLTAAINQYRRTLEIDRNAGPVHELLADTYARIGNYEQAIAEMREALTLAGGPGPTIAAALGADFVTSGYDAAMKNLYFGQLNAAIEASKAGDYVSPLAFAQFYARLGEKDNAFAALEQAFQERHPWLGFLKSDLSFEPLRTDPRFADLVRRIGIPTQSWLRERWLQLLSRLGLL